MTRTATAPSVESSRMTAAVLTESGHLQFINTTRPEPSAQQVLVQLEGSGVCASNLPVWEGREWFNYPHAPGSPGHEGWGCIAAVGAEV